MGLHTELIRTMSRIQTARDMLYRFFLQFCSERCRLKQAQQTKTIGEIIAIECQKNEKNDKCSIVGGTVFSYKKLATTITINSGAGQQHGRCRRRKYSLTGMTCFLPISFGDFYSVVFFFFLSVFGQWRSANSLWLCAVRGVCLANGIRSRLNAEPQRMVNFFFTFFLNSFWEC